MKYVMRWKNLVSRDPVLPGVWIRKHGGHVVRARVKDPRQGKLVEVFKVLPDKTAAESLAWLESRCNAIRNGTPANSPTSIPRFKSYAVSLFEVRVDKGIIKSAASRELWSQILEKHLFKAKFASMYINQIRRADVIDWLNSHASKVAAGKLSPHTVNTWLSRLKTIINAAVVEYDLPTNPVLGVEPYPSRKRKTVSLEQPNTLHPTELATFLECLRQRWPQWYAYCLVGFTTGLRPSHIRPLRVVEDMDWERGCLLIHRSHSRGQEVMDDTKTGEPQRIGLPPVLVDILKWHVSHFTHTMRNSGLLFPSPRNGKLVSRSALQKPFEDVCEHLKMTKRITPRGMRRTAVDIQRRLNIAKTLRTAIAGHKTEEAQALYETIDVDETRAALALVVNQVVNRTLAA